MFTISESATSFSSPEKSPTIAGSLTLLVSSKQTRLRPFQESWSSLDAF
jgi:hypothetical protein